MRKKEGNTQDAGKEFLQAVEFVEKKKALKKKTFWHLWNKP